MVNSLQLGIFAVQSAVFGVVIMVFLLFEPRGLIAIWKRVKAWALLWPYQRAEISEGLG
jgi:branched-chain amino acid transport system permease protein